MAPLERRPPEAQYHGTPSNRAPGGPGTTAANPIGTQRASDLPGPAPNTAGPHKQDMLNKLDPTVDAMHGGTQVMGPGINQTTHGHVNPQGSRDHAAHGNTTAGPYGASQAGVNNNSSHSPQHSSKLANQLDPRVSTSSSRGGAMPGAAATQGVHNQGAPYQNGPGQHVHYEDTPPQRGHHQGMPYQEGHHQGVPSQGGPPQGVPPQAHQGVPQGVPHQGVVPHEGVPHQGMPHQGVSSQGGPTEPMATAPQRSQAPHSSRIANALDPRYDSGDNRGYEPVHGQNGQGPMTNAPPGQNTAFHQGQATSGSQGTQGPHSSRMANVLDPRVSSDRDNREYAPGQGQNDYVHQGSNAAYHQDPNTAYHQGSNTAYHQGQATNAPQGSHGPHSSRAANTLDPRFDSDLDNRANTAHAPAHGNQGHHNTTVHQGPVVQPGPASKTAGPHKYNILNKLDPGVDRAPSR